MQNSKDSLTSMVRILTLNNYHSLKNIISPKNNYLELIGIMIYLSICTISYIALVVSELSLLLQPTVKELKSLEAFGWIRKMNPMIWTVLSENGKNP